MIKIAEFVSKFSNTFTTIQNFNEKNHKIIKTNENTK